MTRRLLVSLCLASLLVSVRCFGVCYDSYDPGNAGTHFKTIRTRFSFVRTYDTHFWNGANAINLAAANGLTIHAGVWLRAGDQKIAADVNAIIVGLRSNPNSVPIVYVGNEDLMNGWSLDMARAKVESVRASLVNAGVSKNVLIGSVQTDGDWLANRGLASVVDVIGVNIYPFFGASQESKTNPIADLETRWNAMVKAFPGKRIELVETGWPHAGPTLNGHVPSYGNAVDYFYKVQAWIANGKGGQRPSYFMFHDNPHKVIGSIEGSFGLANQGGEWKFGFAGDNSGPAPANPTPAPAPTPASPPLPDNLRASFQLVTAKGLVVAQVNNALSAVANTNQDGSFWTFNAATQQVRSNADNRCLDAYKKDNQFYVHLFDCGDGSNGNQKWRLQGQKVIHATHSNLCLDVNPTDPNVKVFGCVANNDNQLFVVSATAQPVPANPTPAPAPAPTSAPTPASSTLPASFQLVTAKGLVVAQVNSALSAVANTNQNASFWTYTAATQQVRSNADNRCLDAFQSNGQFHVHLHDCGDGNNGNQKWRLQGQKVIHATHSNLCLDVNPTDPGVKVFGCVANNDNQLFVVTATAQRARLTNGALALAAVKTKPGQVAFLNTNEREAFWTVDSTSGLVKNEAVGQCLDAYQPNNGGVVHLWDCSSNNGNQKWKYDAATKQLRHATHNGFCLDMASDSGSYPHLWSCHGAGSSWLRLQQFAYSV